jgi:nucleotidyltransferase/DNA polymerase involved in DNA repair
MSTITMPCAESVSPANPRLTNHPHMVHVRYNSFVLHRGPSQAAFFRMRLKPAPVEGLLAILQSFTPAVDPDSTYGFYLNFFGSPLLQHDFPGTLRRLQLQILKLTGINVSIGAATSRIAAAAASRVELPGNLRIVPSGTEADFLADLPVEALHELNGIDASDLRRRGIATIAELQRVPRPALTSVYGDALGTQIWRNSRALDTIAAPIPPAAQSRWGWLRLAAASVYSSL